MLTKWTFRGDKLPNKAEYVERRDLWHAIDSSYPRVVLIDEIDKAPRDFPNDLLHELDRMEFTVAETGPRWSIGQTREEGKPSACIHYFQQ